MKKVFVTIIMMLIMVLLSVSAFSETTDDDLVDLDLDFEIEDTEKKPYSINADIEAKETIVFFDHDALLFRQKYLDGKKEDTLWQTGVDLTAEGRYQYEIIKFYGRLNSLYYYNRNEDFESEVKAEEAYLTLQPSFSLALDVGKKVYKWGKGYAFSPAAFFSRPKDIDDPDATLEGYFNLGADYIKSMDGPLKTLAVTPVVMPIGRDFNHMTGPKDELAWGSKFYFFAYDTDVDFMFLISDNINNQVGMDFSKNLNPSFEIHGEAALVKDYSQIIIDSYGKTSEQEYTALNYLLGLRYLSSQDTTWIFEYYRNGQGYTAQEYENYLTFIEKGYSQYLSNSSRTAITKSAKYAAYYNQQAAMRDYLYLKVSQKEPFDILYFVPAITCVYNMNDQSASITPQLTYSPITNLTVDLKAGLLTGKGKSEYGEKVSDAKITFSVKYYF